MGRGKTKRYKLNYRAIYGKPKGKYKIVYADPPWSIQTTSQVPSGRPNSRPYVAMRQIDIFNLDVKSITDRDCVLFLWATPPLIPEALFTIKSWGFEYKTVGFVWIKKNKKANTNFWGMGWWTRSNPEFCLIATKGNPKRIKANIHSVVESVIEEHSKKPDIVREKIIELCGDVRRIELFARNKIDGWDVWGDEVESDISLS
jgi:N6-adenosine-specific RNA methylase IME4